METPKLSFLPGAQPVQPDPPPRAVTTRVAPVEPTDKSSEQFEDRAYMAEIVKAQVGETPQDPQTKDDQQDRRLRPYGIPMLPAETADTGSPRPDRGSTD